MSSLVVNGIYCKKLLVKQFPVQNQFILLLFYLILCLHSAWWYCSQDGCIAKLSMKILSGRIPHEWALPGGCLWRSHGRTWASPGGRCQQWLCRVCYGWNMEPFCAEPAGVWADSCGSPSCPVRRRRSTSCSQGSGRKRTERLKTVARVEARLLVHIKGTNSRWQYLLLKNDSMLTFLHCCRITNK